MNDDSVICYCFDVKRSDVRRHFEDSSARLEDFILKTGITTKCTACALDLDLLLDDLQVESKIDGNYKTANNNKGRGLKVRVERVDSGFLICDENISTFIRLANYSPLFGTGDSLCTAHRYELSLFDSDGRKCVKVKGRIATEEEQTLTLSEMKGCPSEGWFLLRLIPEGPGYYGTLRPQVVLDGGCWASAYHTQFHTDASRAGRRSGMPLRSVEGRTRTAISMINGSKRASRFRATLEGPGYQAEAGGELPGDGARVFEIDDNFPDLPTEAPLIFRINSDYPFRKNVINRHPDGSLGIDHFPNVV